MSWFTKEVKYYKEDGFVDILKEVDCKPLAGLFNVLKMELVGDVVYIAAKEGNEVRGVVFAIIDFYKYINVKIISEEEGPYDCSCPRSVLELLTPTECELANEWREKCWNNLHKTQLI